MSLKARVLAIAFAALMVGSLAAPATTSFADTGSIISRPLDGVGDSPIVP